MRIIFFIVFYIATYVARIAIGNDIAKTMPASSMRYVFKQKHGATRNKVSEVPIEDGMIQPINKRNGQLLLGNGIDGFSQGRKILNNNLKRIKHSLRKRKKYTKNLDDRIAHCRNEYTDDDDTNEEDTSSNVERFPIWRFPESTLAAINLDSTTNPSIIETEMINRSLLALERPPLQLENLDYDRTVNEAIFPVAEQYPNSQKLFDPNASNKNLILSKIANPKSKIKVDIRSSAFEGLNKKMLLSDYRSGILADVDSSSSGRPQGFQWRYNGHQRDSSNSYNVKEELFDNRLTGYNKRFLLAPVFKDLYILKNIRESSRTTVDGIIIPRRNKLLERDKDNATSAILSFKAHMHHDVKDVGRAYLQRGNHRLFDHNANYLYPTLEPRVLKESTNPTENPVPPSYPNFLYPGIAFQTRLDLINATPEISEEQVVAPVPENISYADTNSCGGINSYDSSALPLSSSFGISNYNVSLKENANDCQQPSILSSTKLDDEINLFQQDGGNYGSSSGHNEFGVKLISTDFRDTLGKLDDNIYTPAILENAGMYLTNDDKEIFDSSQNGESKFSTGSKQDRTPTNFIDDISTRYRVAFDASASEANTFSPSITNIFINSANNSNSKDMDKNNPEYGIAISGEHNNKKSIPTYSNDFDYANRSIDELLSNYTTEVVSFLNAVPEDYVTSAPLLLNTDKWLSKKAQSNLENSHAPLMTIKPLFSESQKLLSAVQLVNRSRLCDKKDVVRSARTEREGKDRKVTNIAKPANKVDHYDFSTENFNSQSLDKRRIKIKSAAERSNVRIRRSINGLYLNKLTVPFHKRESSISDSDVQSGRRNFLKKRKLSGEEISKSDDVEGRRLLHSRFNRNLKSLTENNESRAKPIRQLIESRLKRMKRATTPIIRASRLIKSDVSSENNCAEGRAQDHRGNNQMSRPNCYVTSPNNMPFLDISAKRDISAHFSLDDKRDLTRRNVKRAMSSEISDSGKEKKFLSTDSQFHKKRTAYLDALQLLGKTEKPHIVEYATDVWATQDPTESLPPLIFTTTEFSVSTLTFSPYFTEAPTITASSTIAEKKEVPEETGLSLHEYVTVTNLGYRDYDERNYARTYKDHEYEDASSKISEIASSTLSPVTYAFTITMPTTLPLFYTTELTVLPIDEAAIFINEITTEKITITSAIAITTETETPIAIPTIENFTTESVMLLTSFLEGMPDITLKITSPAAIKTSIEETSALIETAITEQEIVEDTSITLTTEITQSSLIETYIPLHAFSTVSFLGTTETELTIETTTSVVPVSTSLAITKGPQIAISESTFGENVTLYKAESTTAIESSPMVLERTETILSTPTEIAITTLTPEDESLMTQIEKTITAEETATEIPTTTEILTPTEILIPTETIVTTTETLITATKIPTIIETTTTTTILIPTELLTTFKTPITRRTTSAKTLTPETLTTLKTTEISTSIETTVITEILMINKTVTTEGTSMETPTTTETPTSSIIPTTTVLTTTETLTSTEILTTHKTPITKRLTSVKTLMPTETLTVKIKTTTETSTTTEISIFTEITTITESLTITETLTTTEISAFTGTSTVSKIPTTGTIPTTTETATIMETSMSTEIATTTKIPTTKKTTSTKALTPTMMETPSSTETSTISAIETGITSTTLIPTTTATTASPLEETVTEMIESSLKTTATTIERPEYSTISEAAVTVTLAPFSESILSIIITSKAPTTSPEVISTLSKTVSEEFTMSMTESPSITYTTKSFTLFIETTASTREMLEAETEYYIAKEPFYEEEYEEYDTEIPTGKWYDYDEYETTTAMAIKYTKLPKEKVTSSPFIKGTTTSSYEIKTSEFTRYSTPAETTSTYINVTSTAATSGISYTYTEEEITSTSGLETFASTIVENVTAVEVETELTVSAAKEVESTTTRLTFGSTEEYTLPSSTIFKIPTEPLENLTITPKYTDLGHVTWPKFITKPKKIPEIALKKTTTSERISTETEVAVEKLTFFYISSTLTTLSEREVIEVHATTMSTASSEIEGIIETGYEITTLAMTEEEAVPHVTPFITSEAEIELVFTTTNKTIERKEQKEQLLQRLDYLKQHEREMAEREERLKERERQWDVEKQKRRKMMQREKEKEKNITVVTGTTEGYVATTISILITSPVYTVGTQNLTISTEIEASDLDTSITTSSVVEITTVPTETATFSITEEVTSVTHTTEKMEESTIEAITFTTYATEETEETVIPHTTEKSTTVIYITEEIEEEQITDYVTLTPYITTSVMDLYSVGLASIETTTPYTTEEMYTISYVTPYSERLFASPAITSPITLVTDKFITLPMATFSERFEETSVISLTTSTWYTTEETYTATYTDIYGKPLFSSPALEFTSTTTSSTLTISTTTSSTLAISTTTEVKYDEEIERLREELCKKERELEEREKILLEREARLERDIMEFEKYMKEFEKKIMSITPSEKSTVHTSLSTPEPPIEQTTIKAQLTTQIKRVTEKKENRTTTKMVTSRPTEMKDIEEKKRTKYISEKTVTQEEEEEEIVTKRVCLNVLENTTIPLNKRREIATKKICLPFFPEKNKEKKSVGRLNRKLLAWQSTKEIRRPRWNVPSDSRYRRKVKETIRKIDNLQLSHHEWLSNETTKPLRRFKGFTRVYRKMKKFSKKVPTIIDTPRNTTSDFQGRTPLYEQRVLDHHESVFQPTAMSILDSKKYGKRNTFFRYDLISARKSDFPIDNKTNVRKRDVSSIQNNARFRPRRSIANISNQKVTTAIIEENGAYTVNVLHFSYNEDEQMHEVISARPDKDEPTAFLSESNDGIYVTEFGKDKKITTSSYEIEERNKLKEESEELSDEMEKKIEEDDDYIEDMIEDYMNYKEHETSIPIQNERFLDVEGKDKKMTENERESLNQAWPTEKSTTYHLGGTSFWEFDFVTEPSAVLRMTADKSKTVDVSIDRTTCFDVVLKSERNGEIKSNVSHPKRNVHSNGTRKHVSVVERDANLKNVTRTDALCYKLRTKRPRMVTRKLKRDSQKLHGPNYYKWNFEGEGTVIFDDFQRRTSNKDSITTRSRKLCVANANKLKRQIIKHKDATDKHKKKRSTKSRTSQNINLHPLYNTDNYVANERNEHYKTSTANQYLQVAITDDTKSNEKVTHPNIVDHKSKSTSAHERKFHNCFNCICDIANVVSDIKSLLDGSFPLDEIKALNCSEYIEIQDKIVISMDPDVEEAREFQQPYYNIESLKGQKYIKLEDLQDNFKNDSELDSDHDIVSLPGLNLNLPCSQDGSGISWLSSVNRPSYTWKRTDGLALFGFVAENGDLELRNVNAKDMGNYTCVMTYTSPDIEEPVETIYEIHLQVVTPPRYIVHGKSRYHVRSCDEGDLDVLVTYLPLKLNSVICEADVCNAYVLTPSCSRSQITINILLVPSRIVKLLTIDPKHCNVFCLKAIQDKVSLILSKNLQIFLGKTLIFRLPHYEQRLVPIVEKSSFARRKREKIDANAPARRSGNIGLFSSCPAGYGLRDTRCVPCNVGTYSEDGMSHCKRCSPGTYQPNHGARVCRTCTNPVTKGCHNMLWNSFSAVMVTLASVGAMLSLCFLLLWIVCCTKKKFCIKRIAGLASEVDTLEREKYVEMQPLIKDASENKDQQWDGEYRLKKKKKKGKSYINKKCRKQNEREKYDETHVHEDEWESHRIKNAPIINPASYRSHEDYNNHYPKRSYRKGPRLPECDFDT